MINILKMDLYRLFRSRAFWSFLGVVVVLAIGNTFFTKVNLDIIAENESMMALQEDTVNIGIHAGFKQEWLSGDIYASDFLASSLGTRIILFVCSICIPAFVYAEVKSGFVKNVAGQLSNKGILVASKIFASGLWLLLIMVLFSITTLVSGEIIWGDRFVTDGILSLVGIFGLQYLLHFMFTIVICTMSINGTRDSYIFGMACALGGMASIYAVINKLIDYVTRNNIDVSKYMIDTNILRITTDMGGTDLLRVILSAVVVGALFAITSIRRKREI